MASRPKVTQQKRARERARQERQQEKVRRREENKVRRANTPGQPGGAGEDPDIAGIIPGPQPSPWGDELVEDETDEKAETTLVSPQGAVQVHPHGAPRR